MGTRGLMAQEQHNLGCSYSGGGGGRSAGGSSGVSCSRSKKMKQKKVPQRGLGVAQLEKIRIEEQHKKESLQAANILAKNAVGSSADSNSFLAVQKFRQGVSPFPPPLPSDLNSPYRVAQPLPPNLEIIQENYVQVSKQSSDSGGELDDQGQGNLPRLWGGDINLARDKLLRLDHHGYPFDPQSYQETPSPVLPFTLVSQRSHQFHPPPPSMLKVNNSSSGILPPSVVNSQMEPPSNQSFRGNNYATLWTEEDEVVGMKRSYPFSLDSPSTPSSHRSFRPIYSASSSKLDDLALPNNGYTDRMESRNKGIRLGPSNSSPLPETIPNEVNDGKINADFLTLAPPSIASPPLTTKHIGYSGYQGHEYECRPSQECTKADKTFSFFPTKMQSNGSTANESTRNDENGEKLDLNLKL
ncbi:hypothetical protein ACS0TY_016829 [Phlomoides rotata]